MYLPCYTWGITAWKVFWAPASLMALKHTASPVWIEQPLFVLASITAAWKLVWPPGLTGNRGLWLWQLMQLPETHSGAALPPVPR